MKLSKFIEILIPIAVGAAALIIWHWDNPYPYPLNWDIYEHQTLINELLKGNIHLLTSKISDTFTINGYSPLFHIILAILQKITKLGILEFWWFAETIFFLLTVFTSYLLGKTLTNNKAAAILSGILGAFIFENFMVYSSLFLLPQTISAMLFSIYIIRLANNLKHNKKALDKKNVLLLIALFFTHYIVGGAGLIIGLCAVILAKYVKLLNYSIISTALLLSIAIILNFFIIIDPFNTLESMRFSLTLQEKIGSFQNWYGYLFFIFYPIGAYITMKKGGPLAKLNLFLSLAFLSATIAPIAYSLKFYVMGRYFSHVTMALGINYFISRYKSKAVQYLLIFLVLIATSLLFLNSQSWYKSILYYKGEASHISNNEIEAANFLRENSAKYNSYLMISDPATQGILEALSGINTQGGAYMNESSRISLINAYEAKDPTEAKLHLFTIKDAIKKDEYNHILLALSGRFFDWQAKSYKDRIATHFNIWRPQDLAPIDYRYINLLLKDKDIKKVFENEGVIILEIENPPF